MNEIETKIAAAIVEIERLLVPLAKCHTDKAEMLNALDTLKRQLIIAAGRRVIKGI